MNLKKIIKKISNRIVKKSVLNKGDLILATFPKSGTTWFRFIWNNIISIIEFEGEDIDYHKLNGDLKSSIDSIIRPKTIFHSLPVLMATHKAYLAYPLLRNKSIHLYRNPGDTMVSYFEYSRNLKGGNSYLYDFGSFIRSEEYGITAWCKHFIFWQKNATITISYEEMKTDALFVIKRLLHEMDINSIDDVSLIEAIEKSNFKNIRKMELNTGKDEKAEKALNNSFVFARKGEVGQWDKYFSKEDILYTNKILFSFSIDMRLEKIS